MVIFVDRKLIEFLIIGFVNKEKKCFDVLLNCKSVYYEGFWILFCNKIVREFEKYIDDVFRNVYSLEDIL